jgi:hypothetical protein
MSEHQDDSPFLPEEDSAPDEPSPWGFRITLALVAIYLLYRLGQGIVWAAQHWF